MRGAGLADAAVLLAVVALISKLLGFVRELVLANFFGTTRAMDAFIVAFTIPDLLGTLAKIGILTAFIPVYSACLADSPARAAKLANTLLVVVATLLTVVVAVGFVIAGPLIGILAPGFPPEARELAAALARITLPIIPIAGVIGVLGGIQHVHQVFLYPALAYPVWSLVLIAAVCLFAGQAGIYAAAYAVVAGGLLQLAVQYPGLRRCRHHFRWQTDFRQAGAGRVAALVVPALTGVAANHLCLFIDRVFASSLAVGSIAALNYAVQVNNVFIGLFIAPLTTVLYPTLARRFAAGDIEGFKRYLNTSIRLVAFIITPVMLFLIVFRRPVVEVLFRRGAFGSQAVDMTAAALLFFAVGMLGMALLDLLNQSFFAQQSGRVPVLVSGGIILVNTALNFVLVGPLAHGGLALATAVAISLGAGVLIHMLRRRLGTIGGRRIAASGLKIIAASALMIAAGLLSHGALSDWLRPLAAGWWASAVALAAAAGVCALVYAGAALVLKSEEAAIIRELIAARTTRAGRGRRLAPRFGGSGRS